jgi:hypothetical protein
VIATDPNPSADSAAVIGCGGVKVADRYLVSNVHCVDYEIIGCWSAVSNMGCERHIAKRLAMVPAPLLCINWLPESHRCGGYRGKPAASPKIILTTLLFWSANFVRRLNPMSNLPSDLAKRMSSRRELDSGFSPEIFRLPLEAARHKAREIINQGPQGDYVAFVERWRQLPDGQIEFSVRRQRAVQ